MSFSQLFYCIFFRGGWFIQAPLQEIGEKNALHKRNSTLAILDLAKDWIQKKAQAPVSLFQTQTEALATNWASPGKPQANGSSPLQLCSGSPLRTSTGSTCCLWQRQNQMKMTRAASRKQGGFAYHTVDGRNLASLLKQIHAISLRLAPRPPLNIGAQFGQVGLGHARFWPLTTYERFCSSQLNVK